MIRDPTLGRRSLKRNDGIQPQSRCAATALRVGRRRGDVRSSPRHRGNSRDAGRVDGAPRGRVRLESSRDLGRGRDQHRALRAHWTLCGLRDGPLGAAARDPAGPRAAVDFRGLEHADAYPVAAHAAVGRARWQWHGRDVDGARGRRRDSMVRPTPRAGDGRALRGQRDGAARLPPDAREPGRTARVAQRDDDRLGGGRPGFRGRPGFHAGSARRSGPAPIRAANERSRRRNTAIARPGSRVAGGCSVPRVLGAGWHVFHLRCQHERPHRHSLDCGVS